MDLERHRSGVVQAEDLAWADLIILMDRHNWAALRGMGASEEKLVWLGALLSKGGVEIGDPYRMSDADASRTVARLREATELLATRIAESAARE